MIKKKQQKKKKQKHKKKKKNSYGQTSKFVTHTNSALLISFTKPKNIKILTLFWHVQQTNNIQDNFKNLETITHHYHPTKTFAMP